MAKGDYVLFNNVPFQSVNSISRRYGVMFNPSSSNSRLNIVDGGQRYACRLRLDDGTVEYSTDGGAHWQGITSFSDPCTGNKFPPVVTHEKLRTGERLDNIRFDMIAVGRGRIIGKEAGTDRLFHVYMDELFRTNFALCNLGERPGPTPLPPVPEEGGDAPVPPFNMKLDPEYFTTDPPSLIVPPEGTREYAGHPGSLRLPVFNELLELDISDVMLAFERARTWYLKDTRSQLAITSFDDFKFSEDDLAAVFTPEVISDIVQSIKDAAMAATDNPFIKFLIWFLGDPNLGQNWHAKLIAEGFGATILPLYLAFGLILYVLSDSKAFTSVAGGEIHLDLPKLKTYINDPQRNPDVQRHANDALAKLSEAVGQLMLRARRAVIKSYGDRPDVGRPELPASWTLENRMPTANQPPSWMPVYLRTSYKQRQGSWGHLWTRFFTDQDQIHQVWLAQNANGSLEAFAVDNNKVPLHTTQSGPNGKWTSSWTPMALGAGQLDMIAIVHKTDDRLEAFGIVSTDKRLVHIQQLTPNGSWQPAWASFPFPATGRTWIAVETNVDGRLEVFGVGVDKHVWRLTQTSPGVWPTSWTETFASGPQLTRIWMARNGNGTLEAFGIDGNKVVWRTAQDGPGRGWSGPWNHFQGTDDLLISMAVGRNVDGTLEAIGVFSDGTCWRTKQSSPGNWDRGWASFVAPADKMSELRILTNIDGRLEVFGFSNKHIWHTWQTAPNADFNGSWEEIQANDDDRHALAVAPNEDGSIEMLRVSQELFNERAWNLRLPLERRFAIQFSKVLDIGIGSSHWSENWQTHFGGEIHSLLAPRPLFQGERYSLIQYRFLNGPVIDGDAFNDGTTNFYMLVKLGPPGSDGAGFLERYAILWFDEQTYFTQRWRLLHPTDDVLGDLFSLQHALRDNPEWHNFQLRRFWTPFRVANVIDDDSRMAVRRNVILVTGMNSDANRHEIYTIVFNYGLCDHSWRWRLLPAAEEVMATADNAQDQDPPLPDRVTSGQANAYVIVNTIDLRDDTTIHLRGSVRVGGTLTPGRWVQRYLPADCQHVPARYELDGRKPAVGFSHPWDFISEPAYQGADQFYHFGVYEDPVDSRGQYYEIDLLPNARGVTPGVGDVVNKVWSNHRVLRGDEPMKMNTTNFVWSLPKQAGVIVKRTRPNPATEDPLDPQLLVHDFRNKPSISMYEPTTRFRILERKPLGLIAVFLDKRDDELQAASDLPHPTVFVEDQAITPQLPQPSPPSIRVMIKSNRRVYQPPNVRKARIEIDKAPGLRQLHISFWTPQTEQEVNANIWKVSLAAIDQTGVFPMFSVLRFGTFVRRAIPQAPLPLGSRDPLGDEWRYDWTWQFTMDIEDNVRRFCTPAGHIAFATSMWFEDIVGHRAIAEELIFE